MPPDTPSWSDEAANALAIAIADIVESTMKIGMEVGLTKVARTTPRTTIVRVPGKPELTFEITVRRRW